MNVPIYPNVGCLHHPGAPQPGYVVCLHVLQGVAVAHRELATAEDVGNIVCAACYDHRNDQQYNLENLSLVCCHCAREYGLLPDRVS